MRRLSLWGPVVGFMVAIFFVSAQSSLPVRVDVSDKLLHACAYGFFGLLCQRAFHGGLRPLRLRPVIGALLLVLGYALLDEYHQSKVPGRHASGWDWVADAVGAFVAVPVMAILSSLRRPAPSTVKK